MSENITPADLAPAPVKPEPCNAICEDCDCKDCACEDCDCEVAELVKPEPVKAKPAAAKKKETYTAQDGDTFASIAAAFKPSGMSKHAYSVHLSILNGGTLRPGTEVKL